MPRRKRQRFTPRTPQESEADNLRRWIDGNLHIAAKLEHANPSRAAWLRAQAQKWQEQLNRLLETRPDVTNYGGPPQ